MNSLLSLIMAFLPVFSEAPVLKVKSDAVKIEFIADMQNTAGSIGGFVAQIKFDLDDLSNSTISGSVDANTLSTENQKRDDHLKSADYFHAEKYPFISFKSSSIDQYEGEIIMKGIMKIKDIEKEEEIHFSFKNNLFVGSATIQVANYNLGDFSKKKAENTNVKISFSIPVF